MDKGTRMTLEARLAEISGKAGWEKIDRPQVRHCGTVDHWFGHPDGGEVYIDLTQGETQCLTPTFMF